MDLSETSREWRVWRLASSVGGGANELVISAAILLKLESAAAFKERLSFSLSLSPSSPRKAFICANSPLIPFHIPSRPPPPNPFRHPSIPEISPSIPPAANFPQNAPLVFILSRLLRLREVMMIALPKTLVLNGRHRSQQLSASVVSAVCRSLKAANSKSGGVFRRCGELRRLCFRLVARKIGDNLFLTKRGGRKNEKRERERAQRGEEQLLPFLPPSPSLPSFRRLLFLLCSRVSLRLPRR